MADSARGLALDLDGTLMDSMPFHAGAWQRAFAQLKLNPPVEWFYLWEGASGKDVIRRALSLLGVELSADERAQILRLKQQAFDDLFRPLPLPGLEALRGLLEEYQYPTAVVTGSEQRVAERSLNAIGFFGVVSAVVGGDDVACGKPAPDPYLTAARMLGVPSACCLVLENAPLGIESALAAGMPCVAVETTLSAEQLDGASFVVKDLQAFGDLIVAERERSHGQAAWQLQAL